MLKKTTILSLVALISVMAACKKDSGTPANDKTPTLTGTWTLTGIDVTQSTTMIGLPQDSTDSVKIIYSLNYPMSTVTGSFQFTSDSLYVNGLSYSAQPQITLSEYKWPSMVLDSTATIGGPPVSQDSTNLAFPYAGVAGKDSISLPQGGIALPAVVLPLPLTPTGASYTFDGDTLKMTMQADTTLSGSFYEPTVSYFGAKSHLVLKLVKKQ